MAAGSQQAQQAVQTPQTLLEEVLWSISQPPDQARLDPAHVRLAAAFSDTSSRLDSHALDSLIYLDSSTTKCMVAWPRSKSD